MKAAMWGVGLFIMGILGIVLIDLFGNITVTDQFNYTTMKNAVQAAMLDSLDTARYRAGFCLCTANGSAIKLENIKKFSDKSEYSIQDIVGDKCLNSNGENAINCVKLYGQYILDSDKFMTTFQERFANVLSNNKEYEYVIKEIIEYPPKVSLGVISKDDNFFPTDKEAGGYDINNQIDAIIESNGGLTVQESEACYKKGNTYKWGPARSYVGWEEQKGVIKEKCIPTETISSDYKVVVHHYLKDSTTKVYDDVTLKGKTGSTYKTESKKTEELYTSYKNKYKWNGVTPSGASGTIKDKDIEVIYYYVQAGGSTTTYNPNSCTWHYYNTATTCIVAESETSVTYAGYTPSCSGKGINCRITNTSTQNGYLYTWTCICTRSNLVLSGSSLPSELRLSNRNSHQDSSLAVDACIKKSYNHCVNTLSGYKNAKTNCIAVRDYELKGKMSNGTQTTKIITNRTSVPTCAEAGLQDGCSISCLG